jgi:hypothetical protein
MTFLLDFLNNRFSSVSDGLAYLLLSSGQHDKKTQGGGAGTKEVIFKHYKEGNFIL